MLDIVVPPISIQAGSTLVMDSWYPTFSPTHSNQVTPCQTVVAYIYILLAQHSGLYERH